MIHTNIYDVAGIGIGPFNLGLAALAAPLSLQSIFFDAKDSFSWHPGIMLDFARMQVPFYADLVTGAEPANRYNFLSYLKHNKRLYPFAILENNYISRREYNAYCKWVVSQLQNLRFSHRITSIEYKEADKLYKLYVQNDDDLLVFYARHIVIGIGSEPHWPSNVLRTGPQLIHSSAYVPVRKEILTKESITIVGSGQSAAEIFYDIIKQQPDSVQSVHWITRSSRFHPMETAKLSIEMTSPDYIRYFYHLPADQKQKILAGQQHLYKGINQELLTNIYQELYEQEDAQEKYYLLTNCTLQEIKKSEAGYDLNFHHSEMQSSFTIDSDAVILATGYRPASPTFLEAMGNHIQYDAAGSYQVNFNYSIDVAGTGVFVQNAELHSHGFNAPDLGMGPYRNAVILNTILGYAHFIIEDRVAFQSFGTQ